MRHLPAIAATGVTAVRLHPLRSAVTAACVVAALTPYLVGLGLAQGLEEEARRSAEHGADLYVSGEQFGRPAPLPLSAAAEVQAVPGVTAVVPRVVGRVELGKDRVRAVVVGVPRDHFPAGLECVEGRLPAGGPRNELVVGSELARRLNLGVGSLVPPFYHSRGGERVSEVVGVFRSDVSLWQARLVVTSLETAAHIFDQPGLATDLLVWCRPGGQEAVRAAVLRRESLGGPGSQARPRVLTRDELLSVLPQGPRHRGGVFTALFVPAFALAVLAVLVTSGAGLRERRREVAVLKATGWQTDEVMLRGLVESLVIALAGAALSVLLASAWLGLFNGYPVAGVFLPGADTAPNFPVPWRLTPVPALVGLVVSLVVVAGGTLYPTWRAAATPPREAMR